MLLLLMVCFDCLVLVVSCDEFDGVALLAGCRVRWQVIAAGGK